MNSDLKKLFNSDKEIGKRILDSLPVAIYLTDADGYVTHFNSAAVKFAGRKPETDTDKWCVTEKLYHPDGSPMPHEECPMAVSLKENRSLNGAEGIAETPNGESRWFKAYPSPLHNDNGDIVGGINMVIDLSDQKQKLVSKEADMKRLYELSLRLQQQDDVSDTMHEVMMASAELMDADKASVQIYDENKDVIRLVSTLGFNSAFEERFDVIDADGITPCAAALKNREQVLVEDFDNTDEFPEFAQISSSNGMSAVLSTPLFGSDDQFLGVFSMYWKNSYRPGEEKLQLLDLYTQQAARQIERRKAEQVLRRSEEKYRTMFELMDEGFCILKVMLDESDKPVDWQYLETNSAFEEHTGLKDAEGKMASELMPDLEENWFEEYGHVALTGEPVHFQDYTDELERWFEISAFRIGEPHERKVAVLFNNITVRKEAQEEREQLLREVKTERERLTEIFKQAPSFMCIQRGPDHVYERANDLYKKIIGDREIIGKTVREVFPDLEGQGYFELLDRVYETGEPFIGKDMKVILHHPNSEKDPEERYLDFVYQPLRGPDGSVNGIFTQGVDLTERKKAKEELKEINETLEDRVEKRTKKLRSYQRQLRSLASQLNKAEERERQRLAAELHDKLGQMLAVAKMKVDGLQHGNLPGQLSTEAEELQQMVNGALKYNQNLMSELKPPPLLDKEDVTEVLYWTAKQVEKQGLDIYIKNDGQPKPVEKEIRTMLHQSVRELLQNVLKHACVDKARLIMLREKDHVKITVEDNGKGFDLKENSMSPTEKGRFGLFNIQERVDWHGGSFEIESKPGEGTKATLYAPLKEKEEHPEEEEVIPPLQKEEIQEELQQKIKVLLVDDHEMMRRGLRQMIEKQDDLIVAEEASNGQEAVELAREISPHIIIMDVNMPVMDGIEATQRIKAEMPSVRVIGLSLHDSAEVIEDMRSAGVSDYLTKSEAFESLIATIRAEVSA